MTKQSSARTLSVSDLNTEISKDEPRIQDVRLGERLGMAQPLNIRKTIEKNQAELKQYGSFHAPREMIETGKGAKRSVIVYWLNEPQALLLCMFARTEKAAEVRKEVIAVYMAVRNGTFRPEKTRTAVEGGLTLEQQDAVKALVKQRIEAAPKKGRGRIAIACWSAIKAKFGCSYKDVPAQHFADVLSLVARLALPGGGEQTAFPSPHILTPAQCRDIQKAIRDGYPSGQRRAAYDRLKERFDVVRYRDIPKERFDEAMAFIGDDAPKKPAAWPEASEPSAPETQRPIKRPLPYWWQKYAPGCPEYERDGLLIVKTMVELGLVNGCGIGATDGIAIAKRAERGVTARTADPIDRYVGELIKRRRERLGLTQARLATAIGVSPAQICQYEHGAARLGAGHMYDVCRVLKISIETLFADMAPETLDSRSAPTVPPAMQDAVSLRRREVLSIVDDAAAKTSLRQLAWRFLTIWGARGSSVSHRIP